MLTRLRLVLGILSVTTGVLTFLFVSPRASVVPIVAGLVAFIPIRSRTTVPVAQLHDQRPRHQDRDKVSDDAIRYLLKFSCAWLLIALLLLGWGLQGGGLSGAVRCVAAIPSLFVAGYFLRIWHREK